MNNYDFSALNDKEFEVLVVDLLSAEFNVRVERFKPGKDAGVDGRWFAADGRENILQCKHWLKSGYPALLRALKETERPKLDALKPRRYILATSVPLSRANKSEIALAFAPYLADADILGPDDLNLLLARHPHVEERNYKLWLSSINTLGLLLNHAILGRSRSELALFREGAVLYVATEDYQRAWDHLNARRVLVLTGEPGVGKTTLARQLILEYVAQGFSLAVIEENISEAEAVWNEDAKQVFYFDDFLGRTFLEALKAKQDSHITNFARRIAKDPNKRFVLTSRTNILNQGMVLSDLFGKAQLSKSTYELRIGTLSRIDRAQILYNHIWHSNLEPPYVDELYSERRYHEIIKHANFNPRLIAFILDSEKLADIQPSGYWAYVESTLDNPEDVWAHFFSAQMSQESRDLVYITVLNGRQIDEVSLHAAFSSLPPRDKEHLGAVHHAFDIAIRHASGSVLDRKMGNSPHQVSYSLFNPSIADFVLRQFSGTTLWEYYYPNIRTLAALVQIEQLRRAQFLGSEDYENVMRALVVTELRRQLIQDGYSLELAALTTSIKNLSTDHRLFLRSWIFDPELNVVADQPASYIRLLLGWRNFASKSEIIDQSPMIFNALYSLLPPIDEPKLLNMSLHMFETLGLHDLYKFWRAKILEEWGEQAADIVRDTDVLGGYLNPEETWRAEDSLQVFLKDSLAEAGITMTEAEMRDLCSSVSVDSIVDHNIELASRADWQADSWRDQRLMDEEDIAAVDDLFERDGR